METNWPPRTLSSFWNSAVACLQEKAGSLGDDSEWFKDSVLLGTLASTHLNYLTSGNRRTEWVQRISPLTNLLESITWVTVPDIYLYSTLLKNVIYLFIFQLLLLSPPLWIQCLCSSPSSLLSSALSRLLSASIHTVSSSGNTLLCQVKSSLPQITVSPTTLPSCTPDQTLQPCDLTARWTYGCQVEQIKTQDA